MKVDLMAKLVSNEEYLAALVEKENEKEGNQELSAFKACAIANFLN